MTILVLVSFLSVLQTCLGCSCSNYLYNEDFDPWYSSFVLTYSRHMEVCRQMAGPSSLCISPGHNTKVERSLSFFVGSVLLFYTYIHKNGVMSSAWFSLTTGKCWFNAVIIHN